MGPQAKKEYLEWMAARYRIAHRAGKARILDEVCVACGCHRKSAVRRLGRRPAPKRTGKRPGPKPTYDPRMLLGPLRAIWSAAEQPCGRRLVAALPLWLPAWDKRHRLEPEVRRQLLAMSPATADRLLAPVRARAGRGRCLTQPGTLLRTQIPVRCGPWEPDRPGYVEADTVAHCGTTTAGDFIWSLTFTDLATGWTENRATWNRGAQGVRAQIERIERGLPFALLGFDCDNGSEFLNHHLWSYFTDRRCKVDFTRSRPYHKNDQAHVEQKNWTHVRQLLGYERLEHPELVGPINELYRLWGLLHNFFCPTFKLQHKERVGSRIVRRHGKPRTPLSRVLDSDHVGEGRKKALRARMEKLDPFDLNRKIKRRLKLIHELKRELMKKPVSQRTYAV